MRTNHERGKCRVQPCPPHRSPKESTWGGVTTVRLSVLLVPAAVALLHPRKARLGSSILQNTKSSNAGVAPS